MSKKQGNPIDIAKGKALTRRWKELKAQGKKEITEDRLAQILGGARSAIPFWKRGESWPSLSKEQDIERFLLVPLGFFARIGEGMDYREAISPPPVIPAPFADWTLELQKARDILPSLFTTKERETFHMLLSRLAAAFQPENHSEEK